MGSVLDNLGTLAGVLYFNIYVEQGAVILTTLDGCKIEIQQNVQKLFLIFFLGGGDLFSFKISKNL